MNIVYDEFLTQLLSSEIDFKKDSFKIMLLNSSYVPDRKDFFENVSPYEIDSTRFNKGYYLKGGLTIYLEQENDDIKINENSVISWKNLTAEIRYAVIYKENLLKENNNNNNILITCQDLGDTYSLNKENINLSCDDVFLHIGQFIPNPPPPTQEDQESGTLGLGVLGVMKVGKDRIA